MLLKLKGAIVLLLEESYEQKWCKHLVRENGKWAAHTACDRGARRTMGNDILAHKKLSKSFMS